MPAETLEALRGSIRKWEGIVAGTMVDNGSANCPLCLKFAMFMLTRGQKDGCDGCPVKDATGEDSCEGSPYYDYEKGDTESAQRELDFLKSLLPPGEVP